MLRKRQANLHLTVNEARSAAAGEFGRRFPGFGFWVAPKREIKCKVAKNPLAAFRQRIGQLTWRSRGRSMAKVVAGLRPHVPGWKAGLRLSQRPKVWRMPEEWTRYRLRAIQRKRWRRGKTMYRELKAFGALEIVARRVAGNARS